MHGGFAATMLDSAIVFLANCQLDKGFLTMTTEVRVNYFRPMTDATGDMYASAKIDKIGSRVIFVTGTFTRFRSGKIYATANSTELVVEFPPK